MATNEYDYIIVGAGSAGGALAARLTEDGRSRVLLLEAGKAGHRYSKYPISFGLLINSPEANWLYESDPEAGTANREIPVPRGKLLGGSSSINGLVWVRGQTLDYDTWAQMGNRGWSWQDVAPLFNRIEHYEKGGKNGRGTSGPLKVSEVPDQNPLYDALFKAAVAAGYKLNPDYNSEDQEGIVKTQASIWKGKRMSVAHCYIEPAMKRSNLTVITEAHINKEMLEGKRCIGVEYERAGQVYKARAGREVVVCAGGVASPQILELSGIGQPELLKKLGIAVNHELQGVGENYRDHYATRMAWRVKLPITLNEQTRGIRLLGELAKYFLQGRGVLTMTAGIVHGFIKTRPELAGPDIQYHFAHASYGNVAVRALEREPGMTVAVCQLRPESKGSIHVKSNDPFAAPAIRPNFLAEEVDRRCLIDGMKIARRVIDNHKMDRYRAFEFRPGPEVKTDEQWLDFARDNGQTVFHPIGTCKMGGDPMAVVDDQLRVHGIAGLRVADASIMPTLVSGNTNAACIMIGEKAADLMKERAKVA